MTPEQMREQARVMAYQLAEAVVRVTRSSTPRHVRCGDA
jgi:hypothetical protein